MTWEFKPKRIVRRGILHLSLIAGSILFSIPFIWLASTSAKVPDEMYPPRWVPRIPKKVVRSPYSQLRSNERSERPLKVSAADWERLRGPVKQAITAKLSDMAGGLPEFYREYLGEPDVNEGIFARILKRAPDELFQESEDTATSWFVGSVTRELVREVFDETYRRVALSDVVFHGWDVAVEQPTAKANFPWQVVRGNADLITRTEGLRRPAQEVHYSYEDEDSFALDAVLPIEMAPSNLKKIVVSNHGDRSWHKLGITIELAGRKFVDAQPAFLGTDRWQETVWQFPSADDNSIKMKTWRRLEEAGDSPFDEPGKIKLTLDFHRALRLRATFNKYASNYREVLRIVPVGTYV